MSKDVITALSLYHKNVAVKVEMNVEDNLDSDNFYDFWQLSGCAVVLCHNVRHISKSQPIFRATALAQGLWKRQVKFP